MIVKKIFVSFVLRAIRDRFFRRAPLMDHFSSKIELQSLSGIPSRLEFVENGVSDSRSKPRVSISDGIVGSGFCFLATSYRV